MERTAPALWRQRERPASPSCRIAKGISTRILLAREVFRRARGETRGLGAGLRHRGSILPPARARSGHRLGLSGAGPAAASAGAPIIVARGGGGRLPTASIRVKSGGWRCLLAGHPPRKRGRSGIPIYIMRKRPTIELCRTSLSPDTRGALRPFSPPKAPPPPRPSRTRARDTCTHRR